MLIDERGNIKSELKRGEHKSLQTDRVILMPGPEEEVAWVGKMYRWLIEEDLSFREIADRLNEAGVATDLDRPWTSGSVRTVLTNEKYTSCDKRRMPALFGGNIRVSTAALRSSEYPMSSSYPAHPRNRGKIEQRTTSLTPGAVHGVALC